MNDKAQFAIDIAAQMQGGDHTSQQLDELTAKLMGSGRNAAEFEQAIQQVSQQLQESKDAANQAADALSTGETRYAQLEKAALNAAKAAERAALKHGGIVPKELHDEAERAADALRGEAVELERLQKAASAAKGEQDKYAQTLKNLNRINKHVSDRLGDATSKLSTFRGALGDVGGPLGEFGEKLLYPVQGFTDLNEKFGKTAALTTVAVVGVVAVAAAVVALGVAAAVAVVRVAALGVELADQARTAGLAAEAWSAMYPELSATGEAMAGIEKTTGVSADRLRDMTKQLAAAKVSADDMPAALKAVATAEAALGQGAGQEFIDRMKDGKESVGDLATEVQDKFGGIVSRQMLGLEAQGDRLRSNVGTIFGGLEIDPLLMGMSTLVDLFDENTAAGQTMKWIFESLLQPLIDAATEAIPLMEAFFLGILIGAMKIYLKLKPTINAIKEFLGFDDPATAETFDAVKRAGEVAAVVIGVMAAAFGVMLLALVPVVAIVGGALLIGLTVLSAAIVAVTVVVAGLVAGVTWLVSAVIEGFGLMGSAIKDGFGAAIDWLMGFDMVRMGVDLIVGLAKGITAGAGFVMDAVKSAVSAAIGAAKSLLGIASPSKVFAEIGTNTGEGFAGGVEEETDAAQTAMAGLVAPPEVPAIDAPSLMPANDNGMAPGVENAPLMPALVMPEVKVPEPAIASAVSPIDSAPRQQPAQQKSNGKRINLENVQFVFQGVAGAEDAEARFRAMFLEMLEGDLTQSGGESDEEAAA